MDDFNIHGPGAWGRGNRRTSKKAGARVDPTRNDQIYEIIKDAGDYGATGSEIQDTLRSRFNVKEMQSITPAYAILCRERRIKAKLDSEGNELTRKNRRNREQVIWFATEPGDPVYVRPAHALKKVLKLLPSLDDDEIEQVLTVVLARRNEGVW